MDTHAINARLADLDAAIAGLRAALTAGGPEPNVAEPRPGTPLADPDRPHPDYTRRRLEARARAILAQRPSTLWADDPDPATRASRRRRLHATIKRLAGFLRLLGAIDAEPDEWLDMLVGLELRQFDTPWRTLDTATSVRFAEDVVWPAAEAALAEVNGVG